VSRQRRERAAHGLTAAGGLALFGSLFLTWSHQFSSAFLVQWGASDAVRGVPHDPTAWQVYSAADVLLGLLSAGLVIIAVRGLRGAGGASRRGGAEGAGSAGRATGAGRARSPRTAAIGAAGVALAFTLHAVGTPPSNGTNIFDPSLSVTSYVANTPTSGAGETVAIIALVAAIAGLLLSLMSDPRRRATAPLGPR